MKAFFERSPILPHDFNLYNKDRIEIIKAAYKYLPMMVKHKLITNKNIKIDTHVGSSWAGMLPLAVPGSVHLGMFVTYIQLMGTEEHKAKYLEKSLTHEIVGCYAQTEIGHGSDVRNLETLATFDEKTQEWILDSPTLSAAKYWPGEMSFLANYAIILAQAVTNGKSQGVFPFLVEIRDKNYDCLPGIEAGDIGPKIGMHAK